MKLCSRTETFTGHASAKRLKVVLGVLGVVSIKPSHLPSPMVH